VVYARNDYVVLNLAGAHLDEISEEFWLAIFASFEINISAQGMLEQLEAIMNESGE
jgi:hypothetical protein